MLRCVEHEKNEACVAVKEVIICDSKGIIHKGRTDLNSAKQEILNYTNPHHKTGNLKDAIVDADVFIGVSQGDLLTSKDVKTMANKSILFALANPHPEIMPDEAYKGGAAIVGTGRSDLPNQINNVLGFPGIFRGALDARAKRITPSMKLAAAFAIADFVNDPDPQMIIPPTLNEQVAWSVARAVRDAAMRGK